jgi:hypothetical protein
MTPEEAIIGTAEAARRLGKERSVFTKQLNAGTIELEIVMQGSGKTGEKFFRASDVDALKESLASAPADSIPMESVGASSIPGSES